LAIFEEKLAVIGTLQAVREMAAGAVAVETGAVEKRDGRCGHGLCLEFEATGAF
jgi:hypothetical protein